MHRYDIDVVGRNILNLQNFYLNSQENNSPGHTHHTLEISYVKSGSGEYKVDGRTYDIKPGDIFLFNNIEPHVISKVYPPQTIVNMVIHFEPKFIWSSEGNLLDFRFLKIFFERNASFENRLDRNNPYTQQIGQMLLDIENEFIQKETEYELAVKVKLMNIFVLLLRYYGYTNDSSEDPAKQRAGLGLVSKLVEYIDLHYSEDITLSKLGQQVNLSPSYVSTLFKKYNGISLWTYICSKRIAKAMEYLKATDKGIMEIAGLCGFNNTANFNKMFRTFTGTVPSDFRRGKY